MRKAWEVFRDRFRAPTERLRTSRPLQWRTKLPTLALWGTWDARGRQSRALRFVLTDDSGAPSNLTAHLSFGGEEREGLIAITTNLPASRRLHVQVFDDSQREQPKMIGKFVLKNR